MNRFQPTKHQIRKRAQSQYPPKAGSGHRYLGPVSGLPSMVDRGNLSTSSTAKLPLRYSEKVRVQEEDPKLPAQL